jgi:hypothetical protein
MSILTYLFKYNKISVASHDTIADAAATVTAAATAAAFTVNQLQST